MEVLNTIADKVVKDRIMMYQYFKDYDRVCVNNIIYNFEYSYYGHKSLGKSNDVGNHYAVY